MKFTILMPPLGFKRPRPNKHGGYYSPHHADLLDWRQLIQNQMRVNSEQIIEGPVSVSLHIGKDSTDIELAPIVGCDPCRPKGIRGDLDNYVKAIVDSLQGPAFFDDKQVVDLAARFKGE